MTTYSQEERDAKERQWRIDEARNALDKFTVTAAYGDSIDSPDRCSGLVAEAGTGSKYEMYRVDPANPSEDGEVLIVLRYPLVAVIPVRPGQHLHPYYIGEKTRLRHMGDIYAIMRGMSYLAGTTFHAPEVTL